MIALRACRSTRPVPAMLLAALLGAAGCAVPRAGDTRPDVMSAQVELFVDHGDGALELYRVERDGTIHFGGGRDARERRTTWQDRLSDAEIADLEQVIADHGGFRLVPDSSAEPRDRTARLTLRSGDGTIRHEVRGGSEAIESLRSALDRIARRRHDRVLQSLPEPGPRR
jgi:hypothetical protein